MICAGGTGGGVYPALAVHKALQTLNPQAEALWVGGVNGMEAGLVQRAGIPYDSIPAAGVHGVGLKRLPGNLISLAQGVAASRRILESYKPDVLFFTGGYVAVPMALAGMKLPSMLYVPDIEPGLALKTLSYFATHIAITAEISRIYFKQQGKITVTGYPARTELQEWQRAQARKNFQVQSDYPVLLVFGGSKGAHSINQALLEHLPALLEKVEVIHISGELDWPMVQEITQSLPGNLPERYHAFPYLYEEMGAALAAADLVISRAGASTLGELPLFDLPAVLVPYPHAWRYQKVNADFLVSKGAALTIEDAKLKSGLFLTVEKLLETPEKLQSMKKAMRELKQPQAAEKIARVLIELAGAKHG